MSNTILLLAPLAAKILPEIENRFHVVKLYESHSAAQMLEQHKDNIRGLVAGEKSLISKTLLDQLPNLELICLPLTALGGFDREVCEGREISVVPIGHVSPADYTEMALSLLLGLSKRLVEINMMYRTGHWRMSTRCPGRRLSGKSVTLFGDSRIQEALKEPLKALGCYINDITEGETFRTIAGKSDVFVFLPGVNNSDIADELDYSVFEKLGGNGFVISLTRLDTLVLDDMLAALNNRTLGGLGLDSYTQYDDVPKALLELDNVLMTPGVAASTLEAAEEFGQSVFQTVLEHFGE